jgi:4-hydroxybenzoate polyprenyltransferase
MRPKQWIKNLFIFAGLLFSENIFNFPLLYKTLIAFISFSILSSSIYIINDMFDIEEDRRHPIKSKRPIPSGKLKISYAIIYSILLLILSLSISYLLEPLFLIISIIYLIIHILYSIILKNIFIIDLFAIAFGFVLRVVAGTVVIHVDISPWLLTCTILLSLFIGSGKRRSELNILELKAKEHREVFKKYTTYLLDQMISIVTASTVIAYILYTLSEETINRFGMGMIFTVPFVLYGIFRYLYLIYEKNGGGNPENMLLTDKALTIDILFWIISVIIITYI